MEAIGAQNRKRGLDFRWRRAGLWIVLGLLLGIGYRAFSTPLRVGPVSIEEVVPRLEAALEEPNAFRRAGHVAQLFSRLESGPAPSTASSDFQSALPAIREVFEQSRIYDGSIEFALFADWWAGFDPQAAYRWRTYTPQGSGKSVLIAIAERWGRSNLEAAIRTLRTELAEGLRVSAIGAALSAADHAGLGDEALVAALSEIAGRDERRHAVQALMDQRLANSASVDELIAWLDQPASTDLEIASDRLAAVMIAVSQIAPERAARELSARGAATPGSLPPGTVEELAKRWAARDPKAAVEWAASFEQTAERTQAVKMAFQRWLTQERPGALAWAAERADHVSERWFDPVRVLYGRILGDEDPEAGLRVLFELPIDTRRARSVEKVFVKWKAKAPDAAEAWLRRAELPEFRKQELRKRPIPARPAATKATARSPERSPS